MSLRVLKDLFKTPYPYIFILTYFGVWLIWNYIKIPAHNPAPAGIIGYLTALNYNPSNNILRFVAGVLAPPIACVAYWWYVRNIGKRGSWLRNRITKRVTVGLLVLICVLLAMGVGIVEGTTNPANNPTDPYGPHQYFLVDTFHEGESLGPAVSYEQKGMKPYTDFVVRHGVFEDALRSVTAWKLFGRSIGAERTFTSLLYMLVAVCYFVLLLVLFKGDLLKSALGLAALGILNMPPGSIPYLNNLVVGVQLHFRDITTVLFLALAVLGLRFAIDKRMKSLVAVTAGIGFIVTASYANSVDTAGYVTFFSAVWAIMVWLISGRKIWLKIVLAPGIVGMALGMVVLAAALKGDFSGFISYMVATLRYNDYLDGNVFTRPGSAVSIVILAMGALLTAGFFWIVKFLETKKVRGFKKSAGRLVDYARQAVLRYPSEIIIAVAAIVCMRSAIGRTDISHFLYSTQWIYLLLTYLLINYIFSHKRQLYFTSFISILVILFVFAFYVGQVKSAHILHNTFPLHVPDSQLVRPDYLQTAAYLKQNLHDQDSFVTLTSEAVWYYLVNKPSPVQYPIIWYADTAAQRTSLADSIADNPHIKYIVTNDNWTSDIDYISNPTRFPEVYKVLYQDYTPKVGFGQQTIWQRK